MTPLVMVRQFVFLMIHGWKYTHLITFFAGYHSVAPALFARLTGKKCFIILGGTDCFKYPSFRYGNFTKPLYGFATCVSASFASLLIPVSSNLVKTRSPYYDVDSIDPGILSHGDFIRMCHCLFYRFQYYGIIAPTDEKTIC